MTTISAPHTTALTTELRYLALGDSYTIGEAVDEAGRWPMQLARLLRQEGVLLGDPRIIATTGWTTDELDAAITAAEPLGQHDFVSLLIGVNNQYRGRDVEEYRTQFAALLWRAPTVGFSREPLKRGALDAETPITRAFLALSALAGAALPTLGRSESALHTEACAVVSAMADAMLRDDARARRRSLHERIAAAWAKPKAADKIRRALVLLADHDLNASTFAARVAASTGASLAACALSGRRSR